MELEKSKVVTVKKLNLICFNFLREKLFFTFILPEADILNILKVFQFILVECTLLNSIIVIVTLVWSFFAV